MLNCVIKKALLLSIGGLAISCVTPTETVMVDKEKRRIEIQSTSDDLSALPDMSDETAINATIKNLKLLLAKEPRNVSALINLAQIYLVQGDLKGAEVNCRNALKADIKNVTAKKIMAQIQIRTGKMDMAKIILGGLGGMHSRDSQILNMMGMISLAEGNKSEALARFNQALKINPSDIAARMNLGVMYVKYRQMRNAAVQFERVLKIMPDHSDAKLHLAIIDSNRGDFAGAAAIYSEIEKKRAKNPLLLYNMAVMEKNRANYRQAMNLLNTYLDTNHARKSNNEEVYGLIEEIKRNRQQSSGAVSDKEIQALADKLGRAPREEPTAGEVTSKATSRQKERATKKFNAKTIDDDENFGEMESDDIEALERQLQ